MEQGYQFIDIKLLKEALWNYKETDNIKLKALMANMKRNGQVVNLNVRELKPDKVYEVLDGNHRLRLLQKLKTKQVYVYNHGPMTDSAAMRMAVEINETIFVPDPLKLCDVLNTVRKQFDLSDLVKTFPWSNQQLQDLLSLKSPDFAEAMKEVQKRHEESHSVMGSKTGEYSVLFLYGAVKDDKTGRLIPLSERTPDKIQQAFGQLYVRMLNEVGTSFNLTRFIEMITFLVDIHYREGLEWVGTEKKGKKKKGKEKK